MAVGEFRVSEGLGSIAYEEEKMTVLSVNHLVKIYDGVKLIDDLSFSINKGDKLALVGANGTGKTTLLKIIAGMEEGDGGDVVKPSHLSLKYIDQKDDIDVELSIREFCLSSFKDLIEAEEELRALEDRMNEEDSTTPDFERLLKNYSHKSEEFEKKGGYIYKSKVNGILAGLGFEHKELSMPIAKLSGGQLGRLKLAKSLIDEPDILLMDEPTNHLDIAAVEWLETYLKQYAGSVLIVSHDRYFLDKVVTKCLELTKSGYYMFEGNYSTFKQKKEAALKARFKEYEKNRRERERQEEIIKRFKGHGTELLAKRARSREKMLSRMEIIEDPREHEKKMSLSFEKQHRSGKEVLSVESLQKSFGPLKVLKDVSFKIYAGDRVGLIGFNGTGKTTLLKIVMGEMRQDAGRVDLGYRVVPAYYDQRLALENESNTILEEMQDFAPGLDATDIRSLMGRFLFVDDDIFKPVSCLSGGERARVLLSKLLLQKANFLILDEPTNHLDIYAKDVLEDALSAFEGTLLVVSHDRFFLDRVCDKIFELEDGVIKEYIGNYSYYLEKKAKPEREKAENREKNGYQRSNELKKVTRKLEKMEAAIADVDSKIALLEEEMHSEQINTNADLLMEKMLELEMLKKEHDMLVEGYFDLYETLEHA